MQSLSQLTLQSSQQSTSQSPSQSRTGLPLHRWSVVRWALPIIMYVIVGKQTNGSDASVGGTGVVEFFTVDASGVVGFAT